MGLPIQSMGKRKRVLSLGVKLIMCDEKIFMKTILCFFLVLCLSACQATQQSPLPGDKPSPVPTSAPGRAKMLQQELHFIEPRNQMELHFGEDGNGFLLTGGGTSSVALGRNNIETFVVQDLHQSYPNLISNITAARRVFLNSQGQGSIIFINSASPVPITGGGPGGDRAGFERPPKSVPLEIRTLRIQNAQPVQEIDTLVFSEEFSDIELKQGFVDEAGNGFLTLQVVDPIPPNRFASPMPIEEALKQTRPPAELSVTTPLPRLVYLPIQGFQAQKRIESGPDLSALPGRIMRVWLNANQDGLVLYAQEPDSWAIRALRQGVISDQIIDLGAGRSPSIKLDTQGNGYIYMIQSEGNQLMYPIQRLVVGPAQQLQLAPVSPAHLVVADFVGDHGTVVEIPNVPSQDGIWQFKVHQLHQGQVSRSQTLTYPLSSIRIPGLGADVNVTSQGDGLLAWSTLQKGGINGMIHFQALEKFQLAGSGNWSAAPPNQVSPSAHATPSPIHPADYELLNDTHFPRPPAGPKGPGPATENE